MGTIQDRHGGGGRFMSFLSRAGWTLWALVPVAVIAFHFGPGQELSAREVAASRFRAASDLEQLALASQSAAYELHLEAIEARRVAFMDRVELMDDSEEATSDELAQALENERQAYEHAAERWAEAANAYQQVEDQLGDTDQETIARIQWSKARAQVRSGAIWDGAAELEELVDIGSEDPTLASLGRAAREELAVAHYFGARLLRAAGEPAKTWRAEAIKARQHFRYLAESASQDGASKEVVRALEDNVERTIELEQMDKSELEGRPLPRESPRGMRGRRPGQGRPGITQRPPNRPDGRGAGGAGPIGPGW